MTISTDTKNIRKIVRVILERNGIYALGIDDLRLEVELFSAWVRYVNARDEGLTPAESRQKIADEFTETGQSAAGQNRNIVRQEFMDVMGLDFGSEDNTDWSDLLTFLVKAAAQGQTIKAYAEWCTADPYNSPKKHQIAQKPLLVKQTWPSAFVKSAQPLQSVRIDSDGIPETY